MDQARDFARKADCLDTFRQQMNKTPHPEFVMKYITGKGYKLRATYFSPIKKTEYLPFTEWAVCICKDDASVPILTNARNFNEAGKHDFKGSIITYKRQALFLDDMAIELPQSEFDDEDF